MLSKVYVNSGTALEVAPRRTGPGLFDFSGTGSIAPGLDYFPRLVIRPNAGLGAVYEVAGQQNGL